MAKKKRRKSRRPTHTLRKGQCKVITIKGGGRRKLCKGTNGKVRFRKMSYTPRKRSA